jgi:hypothetical protein
MAVHKGIARRQASSFARKAGAKFLAEISGFIAVPPTDLAQMHSDNRRDARKIKPGMMGRGVLKNLPHR